ncbi:hypothetical protein J1N35_044338 [Gossypium stocksii]|uniref:Uncharacterized protein n=1 Tax=Gossypium stocksii TaxID=47602 RepID=A0A9D3ZFN9_9ROSI|nr:hypothetical protein J1N35_044338 [Gossypium stocksii]
MIRETHLVVVISSHISRGNVVIELYIEFVEADGSGPSLTSVMVNTGIEDQAESPTQLCSGFSGLLKSG